MNLTAHLSKIKSAGVTLWAEEGRLRFRAPAGALDEETKTWLRANRDAVLDHLQSDSDEPEHTFTPDPEHRFAPFPLTDVQGAYLLGRGDAFDHGGVACHAYLELAYTAPQHRSRVTADRVTEAWRALVKRHDMLRAVVHSEGYQVVLPQVEVPPVPEHLLEEESELLPIRDRLDHRVARTDQWPLIHLELSRLPRLTVLHLSVDLLVTDHTSLQVLLTELEALLLDADPEGAMPELEPLPVTFRDHVAHRRALAAGARAQADREHWLGRIDGLPGAPELPQADWATTPPPGAPFTRLQLRLDPGQRSTLAARAREHSLTLSAALLTAYAHVVERWSRTPHFLLNVPTFRREPIHPDIDQVVGDFTAVELLEVDLGEPAAFTEHAWAIQAQLWQDLAHPLMTGTQVLAEMGRRTGGQPPIMPVVFTSATDNPRVGDLRGTVRHAITQTPQVWLDCQVLADGAGLVVSWDIRCGVLPDGVVDAMFEAFESLVRRLDDDADCWQEILEVPLPADQLERRRRANDTAGESPEGLLHSDILLQAQERPDAVAVVDSESSITFGELVRRATRVGEALAGAGVRPGEHVAVVLDKSVDQVVAVLGALLAGAVYVPIDTAFPALRRRTIIQNAGATAVLTSSRLRAAVDPGGLAVLAVDELPDHRGEPPAPESIPADSPAYVIYTSGSTGSPKGVVVTHRAARNTCTDVAGRFAVNAEDAVLGVAGLGFDLSVWDIFGVLGAGGRLVLPDPARRGDPAAWAEAVQEHGLTLWNSVPGQLQMLADYAQAEGAQALRTLRLVMLSGDWIPVTLPDQIRSLTPELEVWSLGGATEGSIWSIAHHVGEVDERRPSIPYGTPLRNQGFQVLDRRGRPAPDWVPGELYITGGGVAAGYLGDPERTAERFLTLALPDGSTTRAYRTGDLGRWTGDGDLEFLGREDTQVKLRGYRIELAEIEAATQTHPAVGQAAVVIDDERRTLHGFVEPASATKPEPTVLPELLLEASSTPEGVAAFTEAADRIGLDIMLTTLAGTALGRGETRTPEALAADLGADQYGRVLLRRWVRTLVARGELAELPEGVHLAGPPLSEVPGEHWEALDASRVGAGWGAQLVDTLRLCQERMLELLRGDLDLRQLLFPGAASETMQAAYQDNHAVASLNSRLARAVAELARAQGGAGPLRVLEVGGGMAGTTAALVEALVDQETDYTFTDPAAFFVAETRERFREQAWLRCTQLDPEQPVLDQGWAPNSVDVLVVPNCLHNWGDVPQVLRRLTELVRPGGWVFLLENVRDDNPALQVSMEQMEIRNGPFTDARGERDQIFWTREQWPALLAAAGLRLEAGVAADSGSGQMLFAARAKTDRMNVGVSELNRWLRARLPEYMIPGQWHVLDQLPRTGNGKIDRNLLLELTRRRTGAPVALDEQPMSAMEQQVAALWSELLDVPRVGRDDDFFALGGDSLLVARFVGMLRECVPDVIALQWEVVLRHMLRRPTVAHLAEYLKEVSRASDAPAEAPTAVRSSPFVALHGPGDDPTTVLVHAGTGTAMPYRALVTEIRRRSAGSASLAALEIPDLQGFWDADPQGLIERMAAQYAQALVARGIREVHLVGYCLGGLIATEVSRNLTDLGAEVESMTVISSHSPRFRLDDEILSEYSFSVMMGIPVEALGFPGDQQRVALATDEVLRRTPGVIADGGLAALDGDFSDVGEKFSRLAEKSRAERIEAMCQHVPATAGMYDAEHMNRLFQTFRQSVFAISRYQPEPYAGDVTFLRHSGEYPFPGSKEAVTKQWEEVVLGDLDILDVAGDHYTCLSAENVADVVSILTRTTAGAVLR